MTSSQEIRETIEGALHDALSHVRTSARLSEAAHYAVFPAGKRIRPFFAAMLASDLGGGSLLAAKVSVSIELVHCASLVHDDLPEMDNDDMRRGRPSVHKAHGHDTALLVGDLLLSLAPVAVTESSLSPEVKLALVRELALSSAAICEGQECDINADPKVPLARMYRMKTGALFGASWYFGALIAGQSEKVACTAREVGYLIGFLFQVRDDFIDLFGSDDQRGRKGSSDSRNEKVTILSGYSEPDARSYLLKTAQELEKALSKVERESGRSLLETRKILDGLTEGLIR